MPRVLVQRAERLTLGGPQLADEMWVHYDPAVDLRANGSCGSDGHVASNLTQCASALIYDTPTTALKDVQGLGVYAQSVDRFTLHYRAVAWNEFKAVAVRTSSLP